MQCKQKRQEYKKPVLTGLLYLFLSFLMFTVLTYYTLSKPIRNRLLEKAAKIPKESAPPVHSFPYYPYIVLIIARWMRFCNGTHVLLYG